MEKSEQMKKDAVQETCSKDRELLEKLVQENYLEEIEEGKVNKYLAVKWDSER